MTPAIDFIAGNNDTGDDLPLVITTPAITVGRISACLHLKMNVFEKFIVLVYTATH
jgi:hypothetical protein